MMSNGSMIKDMRWDGGDGGRTRGGGCVCGWLVCGRRLFALFEGFKEHRRLCVQRGVCCPQVIAVLILGVIGFLDDFSVEAGRCRCSSGRRRSTARSSA